jgi:hypothetical protein
VLPEKAGIAEQFYPEQKTCHFHKSFTNIVCVRARARARNKVDLRIGPCSLDSSHVMPTYVVAICVRSTMILDYVNLNFD